MSKLKRFLKVATLGLLPLFPTNQADALEQLLPPTLQEYSLKHAPVTSPIPPSRPHLLDHERFNEYLEILQEMREKGKLTQKLKPEQVLTFRSIALEINSTPDKNRTQPQRDFLFFWNLFRYQLEIPLILDQLEQDLPGISAGARTHLEILAQRMPPGTFQRDDENSPVVFNPQQANDKLYRFISQHLNNPKSISNGRITSIHESYFDILVGLLLIENNFGNTTTSSAGALGEFQILPQTIAWVERHFGLKGRHAEMTDSNQRAQRELEAGFLHIFQLAQLYNIDLNKKPTSEEIVLLTFAYFQGTNSYFRLMNLDSTTIEQLEQYSLPILYLLYDNFITINPTPIDRRS